MAGDVRRALPYDGPHSADTVLEAASRLDALVRYLNNATGAWNGKQTLRQASVVHNVLGGVEGAVFGLDQLLTQLAVALDRLAADPSLYDDRSDRPAAETAHDAADRVRDARDRAAAIAAGIGHARGLTMHLGHDNADAGDEER
ncbi:MAG: hypothetical protein ACRDPQ_15715 [Nocardioidaceae bacterium]